MMPTNSKILDATDPGSLEEAARILKEGGVVAFPTETVYGLGADAFNPRAVLRVFEAKKRPSFDPLIVHVASIPDALALWETVPPAAMALMEKFWPGPLSIVLPKKEVVPDVVTAGLPTVAVRMPDHEIALSLLRLLGRPIAAPSANLFGYTSPTDAMSCLEDLGQAVDLVLFAQPSRVGVESTVLKIEEGKALLLRPGGIPVEEIEKILPVVGSTRPVEAGRPLESPGLCESHYAPWTPLILMDRPFTDFIKELEALRKVYEHKNTPWPRLGLLSFGPRPSEPFFETAVCLSEKADLTEAAASLFRAMRRLDKMNLDFIAAEAVPEKGLGHAIMDRLTKASGGKIGVKALRDGI